MGIRNQRLEKIFCILEYFSGSFSNAKKELVNRGTKAMYEVLKRGRFHNLSIKCQLEQYLTVWSSQ
jgi:hypothetical protein